jgi:hypothetical protein
MLHERFEAILAALKSACVEDYGDRLVSAEDVLILHDPDGVLERYLRGLRALGARQIAKGGGYYWLLKPDLKPGEDFTLRPRASSPGRTWRRGRGDGGCWRSWRKRQRGPMLCAKRRSWSSWR